MDPTEIIKAAPEIVKAVAPIATGAAISFSGVVKRMLGPAADELAEQWRNNVRLYRYRRQISCVKKAETMARDAGFTPKAVPIKLLFPLLEGASLEEDENLHDMWAALLANAASDVGHTVRPGFIALLRELAPDEAALLKIIADYPQEKASALKEQGFDNSYRDFPNLAGPVPKETYDRAAQVVRGLTEAKRLQFPRIHAEDNAAEINRFDVCAQSLEAAGLIEIDLPNRGLYSLAMTSRGSAFLEACSPPKPRA
jgi:hypothetical protein